MRFTRRRWGNFTAAPSHLEAGASRSKTVASREGACPRERLPCPHQPSSTMAVCSLSSNQPGTRPRRTAAAVSACPDRNGGGVAPRARGEFSGPDPAPARAEEALQLSERKARAIFDQTFQFTGLLTPEGIVCHNLFLRRSLKHERWPAAGSGGFPELFQGHRQPRLRAGGRRAHHRRQPERPADAGGPVPSRTSDT